MQFNITKSIRESEEYIVNNSFFRNLESSALWSSFRQFSRVQGQKISITFQDKQLPWYLDNATPHKDTQKHVSGSSSIGAREHVNPKEKWIN